MRQSVYEQHQWTRGVGSAECNHLARTEERDVDVAGKVRLTVWRLEVAGYEGAATRLVD